jgi:hypothetical protein
MVLWATIMPAVHVSRVMSSFDSKPKAQPRDVDRLRIAPPGGLDEYEGGAAPGTARAVHSRHL